MKKLTKTMLFKSLSDMNLNLSESKLQQYLDDFVVKVIDISSLHDGRTLMQTLNYTKISSQVKKSLNILYICNIITSSLIVHKGLTIKTITL